MSPRLPGASIPRGVGAFRQRTEAGKGETRLTCPRPGCEWVTVRPDYAAASARQAHEIRHRKGIA